MANPPITIGPFTNVPAPGSPVGSPWAQQLTQYVVDQRAIEAARVTLQEFPSTGSDWFAPNDGTSEWIGVQVTVPSWSVGAIVNVGLNRLICNAAGSTFEVRLWADGASEQFAYRPTIVNPGSGGEPAQQLHWNAKVAWAAGGGSKRFQVKVFRTGGTGSLYINSQSSCRMLINYI